MVSVAFLFTGRTGAEKPGSMSKSAAGLGAAWRRDWALSDARHCPMTYCAASLHGARKLDNERLSSASKMWGSLNVLCSNSTSTVLDL